MRSIILIALISIAACADLSPSELYRGFITGFYEAGGVDIQEMQACMGDGKGAAHDFEQAVELFLSKVGDHNWNSEEAKRIFTMGLQLVQQALKDCSTAGFEMKKFEDNLQAALDLMSNPSQFAIHVVEDIVVNRVELQQEVKRNLNFILFQVKLIESSYKSGDATNLGYNLGRLVYQVVVGK